MKINKYIIIGLIFLFILLWWTRFQIIPIQRISGDDPLLNPLFIKLDRLTGNVEMINESVIYPPKSMNFKEWSALRIKMVK